MSDKSDIKLGLTQFIKYTLKGSGAQARAVREIKYQDEYHPACLWQYKNVVFGS